MKEIAFPLTVVDDAIRHIYGHLSPRATSTWHAHTERALWRQLAFCILGSRVRNDVALGAIEAIEENDLLTELRRCHRLSEVQGDIADVLKACHPFSRRGALQLRESAECIGRGPGSIRRLLTQARSMYEARRLLMKEATGIGPKQASLFLRNIGYSRRLAVLDCHLLRYMRLVGVRDSSARCITTLTGYERIESVFVSRADSFGCQPSKFDLAVWIVMRVAKRESRSCV